MAFRSSNTSAISRKLGKTDRRMLLRLNTAVSCPKLEPRLSGWLNPRGDCMQYDTVFVLGAGASRDLDENFPVGSQLAHQIEQTMASEIQAGPYNCGQGTVSYALLQYGGFGEAEAKAMRRILDGVSASDSIDKFIDEWQGYARLQEIAKISIALHILNAERSSHLSKLKVGAPTNAALLRSLKPRWIGTIANNAGGDLRRRDFEERLANIAFVTFNYDRTLEWYLAHYISTSFDVRYEEAVEFVREMPIMHVYGSLGDPFSGDHFQFGSPDQFAYYAAKNILTFCEEVNSDHARSIAEIMLSARKTVFLGCAFHKPNLRLLYPHDMPPRNTVYGTCQMMRDRQLDAVRGYFEGCQVNLRNQSCTDLMNEAWEDIL